MLSKFQKAFFPKWWKYYNLFLLFCGLALGIFLYNFEPFHNFLLHFESLGYIGAFIAGILYVSTVTVATSIVILLVLAEKLSVLEVGLIAGFGALLGDWIIYRFVKDNLYDEMKLILEQIQDGVGRKRIRSLKQIFRTKYFNWLLPVVGVILIGSPFPDELAWGLMGTTKIKTYQVVLISFVFNFAGIVLILSASNFIKP